MRVWVSVIKDAIRKAGFDLQEVRSSGSCAETSPAVTLLLR